MTATTEWLSDHLGPVEVVAFTLTDGAERSWQALLRAVNAGVVRILDLEFLRRNAADEVEFLTIEDLPAAGSVPPAFVGSRSDLLDETDAVRVLAELKDGEVSAVLLVEHLGLLEVLAGFEAAGSRLLLDGAVSLADLASALDDTNQDEDQQ